MRITVNLTLGITVIGLLLLSGCKPGFQANFTDTPSQIIKTAEPTRTASPVRLSPPTNTPNPTSTQIPNHTKTTDPTLTQKTGHTDTPSPTPTLIVTSGVVHRLCPDLSAPLGLFNLREPYIDSQPGSETIYALYEISELGLASPPEFCTLYLSPPPQGAPQLAGDTLFWKTFDYDNETVAIWQYDPLDKLSDDVLPQHVLVPATEIRIPLEKSGLVELLASPDAEILAWAWTDPELSEEGQYVYNQNITVGWTDRGYATDIWSDVVPEDDGRPHIIRLVKFSEDKARLYYSDEPVGLGRQWPEPAGRYTALYSIPTLGGEVPRLHYDCGMDYWCITDFSEAHDLLLYVRENDLQITKLGTGEAIATIGVSDKYSTLRQALISPDGGIAFLGVVQDPSDYSALPEEVSVFYLEPPYEEDPMLVLSDVGLRNLLGWVSPVGLLADGNFSSESPAGAGTIPNDLMLVWATDGSSDWLPREASGFESLVP
jgi:hypothetical protein